MRFKRYGTPRENLTERLEPMEKADEFIFARLNSKFDFLVSDRPELLLPFEERLVRRIEELGVSNRSDQDPLLVAALTRHHPQLPDRQELVRSCLDVFLDALGLSIEQLRSNEEIEVTESQFQRSAMRVDYAYYLALRDLVGREEAKALCQDAITQFVNVHDGPFYRARQFGTLASMRQHRIRVASSGYCGRVRIISTIEDGKFIERCENCEKVEGLAGMEFEDPEVLNAILCAADFPVTRLVNDFFVMTRRKTIAGGHPYCDNVFHDIRIARTVEHPDDDFIAQIHTMVE
jgi:hypothetical protein